jgi:peptide/nickel transport system permease protein
MMVAKRFFRNKLALTGLVIIIAMFAFAFLGGMVNPYSQSQVFYTKEVMNKDYAGATKIKDYQIMAAEGVTLPSDISSNTILAISSGKMVFESKTGETIGVGKFSDNAYFLYHVERSTERLALNSTEKAEAEAAGSNVFELDGVTYLFDGEGKKAMLYTTEEIGVACKLSFTAYSADTTLGYDFIHGVLTAMRDEETTFTVGGEDFSLEEEDENSVFVNNADGEGYAYVCDMNITNVVSGVYLTPEFKLALTEAIANGEDTFTLEGDDTEYTVSNKNGEYIVKTEQETKVIDTYAAPSRKHPCGTDANGMDLLARLMYGGRISLLIGFVVVIIETIIGVIFGGIAGYFGGWVDNLIMRIVDVVYCIPVMPLYLILGSVMDYYQVSSTARIYLLCVIMSVVGWVSIARIVRGQILSLREQEFMVAAEATGISVKRRIFKHLIPNVIPQLIVFASMGLGDIILTEATLSFLGLGVKYPAASWGSIINAVNDSYVMTNYLFVWLPAGFLILLTVLAFNFIGDGLRDAFDPKMKR